MCSCVASILFSPRSRALPVLAGCFTGYLGVALVVARFGLESGAHELHTALFMLIFVAFHIFARKRMAFAIPLEYQTGSLYGHRYHDAATDAAAKKH
jgi:hypothetical protein